MKIKISRTFEKLVDMEVPDDTTQDQAEQLANKVLADTDYEIMGTEFFVIEKDASGGELTKEWFSSYAI